MILVVMFLLAAPIACAMAPLFIASRRFRQQQALVMRYLVLTFPFLAASFVMFAFRKRKGDTDGSSAKDSEEIAS